MSRSWKKTPGWTGSPGKYRRFAKRQANGIVRRTRRIQDGGWYRKLYPLQWEIKDFVYLFYNGRLEYLRRIERDIAEDEAIGYSWYIQHPPEPWRAWTK